MKSDRKIKTEKAPPQVKAVKGVRQVRPKTNGKHPLASYEHIPIGIVECALDGTYIDVNEEFCRITGYTRSALLRRGIRDLTHEDDYALDIKLHEELIAGKIPFYRLEKRYVRKDGSDIWVELTRSLVRHTKGKPLYTIGVVLDISERKQVERVLRESVERLRLATEAAQMFTWEWDFQNNSYSLSDSFTQVLGFQTDLLSKNPFETISRFVPAEDLQSVSNAFQKTVENQRDLQSLPCRVIDPKDGQIVWLEISAKIVYDPHGNPERMFGVAQNITESKNIQSEIAVISRMPEENPNPVMRIHRDGKILYANPASAALLEDWMQELRPVIPEELQTTIKQTFTSGRKTEIEFEHAGKWFSFTVSPLVDSGYINLYGKDITESKKAEQALRSSEERMRLAIEANRMVAWEWDVANDRVTTSENFAEIYGLSAAAAALNGAAAGFALIWPEDLPAHREKIDRITRHGGEYHSEFRVTRPVDGRILWIEERATALMDASGQVTRLVGVVTDITERKRAESELAEYARQQESLYRLSDRLHRTESLADVFDAALDAILSALQCDRASILLYDDTEVMRFVAWRGLSDAYRQSTEGHSPWKPDTIDPEPISMYDVRTADLSESLRVVIEGEGIGALAFIPLVSNGKLIGKFMMYFNAPHQFDEGELDLSLTIGRQLATAIDGMRAEEELRQSEERFRQAANASGALVYEVDLVSGASAIVHGLESLTGYDPHEFSASSEWWHSLIHPEDLPTHLGQLEELLKKGGTDVCEYCVLHKNGEWIFVQDNRLAIMNESGEPVRLVGAVIDITARKRSEETLARERELLERLFETMPVMVSMIDPATLSMRVNAEFERRIGWKAEEVTVASMLEALYPDPEYRQAVLERMAVAAGTKEWVEAQVRTREGRTVDSMWANISIMEGDKLITGIALGVDITERKQTEQALRESEERFRTMANTMPSMVWTAAPDGTITYVNDQWFRYVGITPEANATGWPELVLHPDDYERCVHAWTHALETVPDEYLIEVRNRRYDGQYRWFQTRAVPVRDDSGKAKAWYGVTTDIHERIEAEHRMALLAGISDMLRNVDNPSDLMYRISEAVGEHLLVKRALFNETDLEQDREIVHRDYHREVDSVAGIHKVSAYSSFTSAEMAAGRTVINTDSKTDPRTTQDYERTYAISGERAYVAVPLMRENRWVASFWVSDDTPRQWSAEEVSLLETVAERTWAIIEKLRLAEELRAKEAELDAIINQTPFMLTRCTRDLRYRFVSRAYADMIGRPPGEVAGKPIVEIMGEEGLKTISPYIETVLQGQRVEYETAVSFKGVGAPYLHVVYTPDWDEQGNVVGWFGSIVDITERRRIEEALSASEQRFREIFETAGVSVLVEDFTEVKQALEELRAQGVHDYRAYFEKHPDFVRDAIRLVRILDVNNETLELFAAKKKEDLLRSLSKIFTPETEHVFIEELVALFEGREMLRAETQLQTLDGQRISVLFTIHFGPQAGDQSRVVVTLTDITARKQAEEAVRRNEQMFSTLVEAAPFGVYFIDSGFRLRAINKGSEAVFSGIDPLIGRDFAEILHIIWEEPFATEAIERFRHTLRSGESYISPTIIEPRANINEIQSYDWQIHRITLPDGSFGVVCYFYDLSEQKQMEAAVRASEALYRTIARSIPGGGVYVVDTDFRYLVAEGPVTEAFGLSREMLEGHTVSESFPDERGQSMEARLQRTFAGELVEFETEFNGRVYWTQQAPLQDSIGQAIILTLDITERKRAEEALRQSEERFARFMQHLPGLAWIKDLQGRYVYANAAAEKAFNTARDQLYGRTDEEIFPPEVAAQFKENDRRALSEGQGVQVIETMEQEDTVLHSSLVSKFPIPGPDGSPALIGGTAFDITERLSAEEALRESEQRFSAILRQATAGIVRKDADGRLVFVNQAFCNMLGYTEEELVGKTMWEVMYPEDVAENKKPYERLMAEGTPFKLERRLLRADGSVIWVDASVSPIMDSTGKPQSAVTVEVDITGRKQAEEALRELNLQLEDRVLSRTARLRSVNQTLREEITERKRIEQALRQSEFAARTNEEKLRTLFDLLPVGISFLSPEGQIIQMNSALPHIMKLSKDELLSQSYKSRKYIRANGMPMSPAEFASARALAEGRTIHNIETGILLENGEVIWTNVSAAPVDVADVGVVVVTVDITDSKRAERALQESHQRLRVLSQRLVEVQEDERRALARELHDRVGQTLAALNINLIIISSQLSGEATEQIGARLNDSMKLVAETIALVRDVMTDLRPAVLDDYGLEAALESHLSQYISRYSISAKFEKPDQPLPRLGPSVEMTMLRIAQEALMNIAKHAQATQVDLSLRLDGNTVCLTIQDNGIGIESWQEANRPGSHGLTIMRERAEAFDGSLRVKSVPGQGTVVEVTIPFMRSAQNEAQERRDL